MSARVVVQERDGAFVLTNPLPLASSPTNLGTWLRRAAERSPEKMYVLQRARPSAGPGAWSGITYGEARPAGRSIEQRSPGTRLRSSPSSGDRLREQRRDGAPAARGPRRSASPSFPSARRRSSSRPSISRMSFASPKPRSSRASMHSSHPARRGFISAISRRSRMTALR